MEFARVILATKHKVSFFKHGNWLLAHYSLLGVICFPSPLIAQVALETVTDIGTFQIVASPMKSTYLGAYDFFVGPAVKSAIRDFSRKDHTTISSFGSASILNEIQNRRRRPSAWKILFPNGKIPSDASITYGARPGYNISLKWLGEIPLWPVQGNAQMALFIAKEQNQFRVSAPGGLGILTDPTVVMTKTGYRGVGASFELPVFNIKGMIASHTLRVGGGLMAYETRTVFQANSAFLRLGEVERKRLVRPLVLSSYSYRLNESSGTKGFRWVGVDVTTHAIQTQYFWAAGLTAATVFRF
jgi:hypothetical protein